MTVFLTQHQRMKKSLPILILLIIALVLFFVLSGRATDPAPADSDSMTDAIEDMSTDDMPGDMESGGTMSDEDMEAAGDTSGDVSFAGTYEAYDETKLALAADGSVVLFFRADWCPSCRALDRDIKENMTDIPAGVVILDVDYDKATALRQQYGVTTQHTLVQVDENGAELQQWSGGSTLDSVLAKL